MAGGSEAGRRADRAAAVMLWLRLARVYNRNLRAAEAQLRAFDLTAAQFDVLAQVGRSGEVTQRELARRLLVSQGNVTQLLVRMERRGLLSRRRDGRAKQVALTDAGRALHDEVLPLQEELHAWEFRMLTQEERHRLLALLRRVQRGQD